MAGLAVCVCFALKTLTRFRHCLHHLLPSLSLVSRFCITPHSAAALSPHSAAHSSRLFALNFDPLAPHCGNAQMLPSTGKRNSNSKTETKTRLRNIRLVVVLVAVVELDSSISSYCCCCCSQVVGEPLKPLSHLQHLHDLSSQCFFCL